MQYPKEIVLLDVDEYNSFNKYDKAAAKNEHKEKFEYIMHCVQEENPLISGRQVKAKALTKFLELAGINAFCLDEKVGNDFGLSIFDRKTKENIGFILNHGNTISRFYCLYYDRNGTLHQYKLAKKNP